MKTLLLLVLIRSAFAQQIFPNSLSCLYTRTSAALVQRDPFTLNKSGPRVNIQKRESGVLVMVDGDSFKVEFREGSERKVQTQSVKDVWSLKRQPSELRAETKFGATAVEVTCR